MVIVPKEIFFTRGVGRHSERLSSFELALREAGIAHKNLVGISGILPPWCKIVGRKTGISRLSPGEITYCVMARQDTNENRRLIVSSIGCAIPADRSQVGYLSEHNSYGQTGRRAGDYAEDLAASMLATSLGIEFDPTTSWSQREQVYRMSKQRVKSRSVTQSARGQSGLWTTVFVAAVVAGYENQ